MKKLYLVGILIISLFVTSCHEGDKDALMRYEDALTDELTTVINKDMDHYNIDDSYELLGVNKAYISDILGDDYIEQKVGVDDRYDGYYFSEHGITVAFGYYNALQDVVVEVWFDDKVIFQNLKHDMKTEDFLEKYKDEVI